jgi:hypothetical protein
VQNINGLESSMKWRYNYDKNMRYRKVWNGTEIEYGDFSFRPLTSDKREAEIPLKSLSDRDKVVVV